MTTAHWLLHAMDEDQWQCFHDALKIFGWDVDNLEMGKTEPDLAVGINLT